ncbi:MAG: GNAT family N-acetyltransferase [Hyphomonadaceae bacterium]
MSAITVRDAGEGDEDFILALNAACTPAVGDMTRQKYRQLAGWSWRTLVAEAHGKPVGFMILVRPGSSYPSDNYGWFETTFARHLYVDRIAVAESARGLGVGRALYEEALRLAAELGEERVTAEVNEDPPNPESMAFHMKLGFRHLLSRMSGSGKRVAMLERPLNALA